MAVVVLGLGVIYLDFRSHFWKLHCTAVQSGSFLGKLGLSSNWNNRVGLGERRWRYIVLREWTIERREEQEHLARCNTAAFVERKITSGETGPGCDSWERWS